MHPSNLSDSDNFESLNLHFIKNIIQVAFSKKRKIIIGTLVLTFIVAIILFILPNKYKATAVILPSSNDNMLSQYSSLANLVGLSLPGSDDSQLLYPDIILSERLLKTIADKKWKYSESDTLVSLYDLYSITPWNVSSYPEIEKEKLLFKYLREKVISVDIDRKTNILTLSVVMQNDPHLAAELTNFLLEQLNNYNNNFRKSKSEEEEDFLESRLKEIELEMVKAENDQKEFEEKNYNWSSSPELRLAWQRLNRAVQVNMTMWIELKKQYEIVKLNVLREKTTIDVLDYASIPAIKDAPMRTTITAVSFVFFFMIMVIYAVFEDKMKAIYGYLVDKN